MTKKNGFKTFYAVSFAWQLGFLIAVPIGGFLLLGYWADGIFHTGPLLLFIGMIVGLSVTVYEVYHSLAPFVKNNDKKDD